MIALLGFILLIAGGEVLVRNRSALAIKASVPPLIVGLTVISIGTSTPELFTSLQAAWNGVAGISVGNVIGSNIANLGLALGLTAVVKPIIFDKKVLALDFPTLIVVTALFGADFFIDGAVVIAEKLGGSEFIIGVTVVAFGTSVPEIFASVFAALKGEGDLSIGNLIGSNVMNILLVLGGTSLTKDVPVEAQVMSNDYWWMLGAAVLLYPILKRGSNVNRFQGALYICFYIAYVWIAFG